VPTYAEWVSTAALALAVWTAMIARGRPPYTQRSTKSLRPARGVKDAPCGSRPERTPQWPCAWLCDSVSISCHSGDGTGLASGLIVDEDRP
jgi:hypothetical protein